MWLFSRVSVLLFIAIIYHTNGVLSSGFFTFFRAPGRARWKIRFLLLRHGFPYFPPGGFGSRGRPVEAQV